MPHAIQHHALIPSEEMRLQAGRRHRFIAGVRTTLDHQGRDADRFNRRQLPLQLVIPMVVMVFTWPFGSPTAAVRAECDFCPVLRMKAPGRLLELLRTEPPRRTPGLPLEAREADRVCSDGVRTLIQRHEPLVPELTGLREVWQDEATSRLKREGKSRQQRDPFRHQCGEGIRHPGAPVVTDHRASLHIERVQQIHGVLHQRHPTTVARCLIGSEAGRSKPT